MDFEDIQNYNEQISAACFWVGATEYQDYLGNWRELGDVSPIPAFPAIEIIDGEIIEPSDPIQQHDPYHLSE